MYLGKEVKVFLKGQAKEAYLELKKKEDQESKAILKSFERIKDILKDNPQHGDPIRKEIIPSNFKKEGITNLYRAELSNYWRIIYTLTGNEVEVLVFVLNIVDHPEYNKIFGYKKK
jgi:hypothetical protein